MTDRELLELAAKAAGIAYYSYFEDEFYGWGINIGEVDVPLWNPITVDGDALRLAVKLHLALLFPLPYDSDPMCGAGQVGSIAAAKVEPYTPDPYAATRRAIVRAAAEIGKGMKHEEPKSEITRLQHELYIATSELKKCLLGK